MIVPSTVTLIGVSAFSSCVRLEKIELQEEGIEEIGQSAFYHCKSLKHIHIPTTIKRIGGRAFYWAPLVSIDLPDGIESIGMYSFGICKFNRFRIPVNITSIPESMLYYCKCLVSVEIPAEGITQIKLGAFTLCSSLRNIALPSNADVEGGEFNRCSDLSQLFGSEAQMMEALKCRFDNLPIHKMLYYQSYQHVSPGQLTNTTNKRSGQRRSLRSKLEPTGNQQDCLGMTPLHILACSTVQDLSLYKVLIEKYPENLIVKDRWGDLPLFYVVLGNHSSSDIVQFFVECYHSLYPNHEFNWTKIIGTMAGTNAPKEAIQNLVDVQHEYFPNQNINWSTILDNALNSLTSQNTFASLVEWSISERVKAIGVKYWRDELTNVEYTECGGATAREQARLLLRAEVEAKLAKYETEYHNLKEATTILELVLWKHKMGNSSNQGGKKRKVDESNVREHCRISCGADIVVQHVLQYLLPA